MALSADPSIFPQAPGLRDSEGIKMSLFLQTPESMFIDQSWTFLNCAFSLNGLMAQATEFTKHGT